ncbi:acetyl-CoA carboxylase carboxyltransferase subunit alpha [Bacteroidetes/Chlorobi group bacterium ChocPot_Mid]|nr:MAG: acetyl-CoA carboxylase carboxyltransferase subunit alpha [Bacteroidetes/Chlorobi group bacterium ChocPot_Mid]
MATNVILDFEKPIFDLESKISEMRNISDDIDISSEIEVLEKKVEQLRAEIYRNLTRWQRVQIARHPQRPITLDYITNCFTDFIELHGDRTFRDDPAIIGGIANLGGEPVMVLGHQKGRDTKSNVYRNFGMANPEGYRKALRLFKIAEKFGRPIINFLDTPGAYPGLEAEERGQAEAIARNLLEMSKLKVPIIVVIIGEGASGGAIGIGVGDRILMLENAWYSVISPESCSSILWRSWDFKEQAAEALQLTSFDLKAHNLIDEIIYEPIGGAHRNPQEMFRIMSEVLSKEVSELSKTKEMDLIKNRREKFYKMGVWIEE